VSNQPAPLQKEGHGSTGERDDPVSRKAQLRFRGQLYHGSSLRTHPPYTWVARIPAEHMTEIGTGVIPGGRCATVVPDRSVPVASIEGVDPGIAIAMLPHGSVFVAELSLDVIRSVVASAAAMRWDYSS
jgi:hypothetical protein